MSTIVKVAEVLEVSSAFRAYPPISVVGLGYVGAVSAACLAEMTHQIVGVDIDPKKTGAIQDGRAPLVEVGLDDLMRRVRSEGRITATASIAEAVETTDVTFICVGTPSCEDGSVDLGALRAVATDLGRALADKDRYHLVVVRSTIPVGTTRNTVLPILERFSGKRAGQDFGVCFHPEFLREGLAIADFFAPPKTVIGGLDKKSSDMLAAIYGAIDAPLIKTTIEIAELVKYVDNNWHAVKVSFANEIGKICKSVAVDSHEVMSIFVQDTKLNLSPYYMRPGFAFGGSCLPKDVRALQNLARSRDVSVPLLDSLLRSNDAQIEHALSEIEATGAQRVAVLGVTFKPGTDDLRESPFVELMGRLLDRGCAIRACDPNITPEGRALAQAHAKTASLQTRHVLETLPAFLNGSTNEIVAWADLILVCHNTPEFADALRIADSKTAVLDLVRLPQDLRRGDAYVGICW